MAKVCYYNIRERETDLLKKNKEIEMPPLKKQKGIDTMKKTIDVYAEVKTNLKAELGDKYPTNKNGLSEAFIVKMFAPHLKREDVFKIFTKRKEFRANTKRNTDGEQVKVGNWFPAFRSWFGAEYFPEFNAKKAPKAKTDEMGKFLEELLAEMGA